MDKHESGKHCRLCHLLKPLSAFAIGRDETGHMLYHAICNVCRQARATDDNEESGDRRRGLAITHEDLELDQKNQIQHKEEVAENAKEYIDEQDTIENKKETTRQENSTLRRAINNLDKTTKKSLALFSNKQPPTTPESHTEPQTKTHDLFKEKIVTNAGEAQTHLVLAGRLDVQNIQSGFFGDQLGAAKAHGARITDAPTTTKRTGGMFSAKKPPQPPTQKDEAAEATSINKFVKGRWGR